MLTHTHTYRVEKVGQVGYSEGSLVISLLYGPKCSSEVETGGAQLVQLQVIVDPELQICTKFESHHKFHFLLFGSEFLSSCEFDLGCLFFTVEEMICFSCRIVVTSRTAKICQIRNKFFTINFGCFVTFCS